MYDQITDVSAYTAEQRGNKKEKESFLWSLKFISGLRSRNGAIYIRFGELLKMSDHIDKTTDLESDDGRLALPKLAFDVSTRINDVTPITPISLVTMALLSQPEHGFTPTETIHILEPFLEFVRDRDLPIAGKLTMNSPDEATAALEQLVANKVVTRTDGLTTRVYTISHDQHLAAAYYRNTIIHFFVPMAIAEVALALGFESDDMDEEAVLRRAVELRDLLKFEFFFSPTSEFEQEILSEINRYRIADPDPNGPVVVNVAAMYPAKSPIVLRPFLEAYLVVAEALALAGNDPIEAEPLQKRCLQLGEQMYALSQIRSREAVTTTLYASGIDLAKNRGLLEGTHQARMDFRDELQNIRIALNGISDSA
jgi:glycerol-3-phosphate O-acyltransferase